MNAIFLLLFMCPVIGAPKKYKHPINLKRSVTTPGLVSNSPGSNIMQQMHGLQVLDQRY